MTTILPIPAASNTTGAPASSGTGSNNTSSSATSTAAKDQNMFMQLLVAQLENQDPTQPMDSTTFITQLAQFQQLQQAASSGEDITAIRNDMDQLVAGQTANH